MAIIRPTIYLNFANAKLVAARRLSVSRASGTTAFDATGKLVSVPANAPAFDHDIVTGESLGLATMGTCVNVVLYNRDLTNAVWTKTNITAAKDQTGLDGVASSASSITATAADATVIQSVTASSSIRDTFAHVKRITGSGVVSMTLDGGETWAPIAVSAAWERVSLTRATLVNPQVGFKLATSGDAIAVDFVSISNGQGNAQPIQTAGSAVTVNNDVVSMDVTGLVNPDEGTLFTEFTASNAGGTNVRAAVSLGDDDASPSDVIRLGVYGTSQVRMIVTASAATLFALSLARPAGVLRMAASYKKDSWYFGLNGVLSAIQSPGAVPAFPSTLYIGSVNAVSAAQMIYGHTRRVIYWPRRLTTAEVQAITA